MFNINVHIFKFSDLSIFCAGLESNIDKLIHFYKLHQNNIDPQIFIERIVFHKVYARYVSFNKLTLIRCSKFNHYLFCNELLMDLPYFDEISFIANPHEVITLLEFDELYGKKLEISEYWRSRLPHLQNEFSVEMESPVAIKANKPEPDK